MLDVASINVPMQDSGHLKAAVSSWVDGCVQQLRQDGAEHQQISDAAAFDLPQALAGQSPHWRLAADLLLREFQLQHAPLLAEYVAPVLYSFFSYYSFYLAAPGAVSLRDNGFQPNFRRGDEELGLAGRVYGAPVAGGNHSSRYGQLYTSVFEVMSSHPNVPGFEPYQKVVYDTESVPAAARYCCGPDALQPLPLGAGQPAHASA
jgi:hypothetical protein